MDKISTDLSPHSYKDSLHNRLQDKNRIISIADDFMAETDRQEVTGPQHIPMLANETGPSLIPASLGLWSQTISLQDVTDGLISGPAAWVTNGTGDAVVTQAGLSRAIRMTSFSTLDG